MTHNILTAEHRRQIIEAEQALSETLPIIDALEDCGTECREVRAAAVETLKRLAAFKENFTTPKRTRKK